MPTIDLLGTTLNITARGTTENVGFNDDIALIGGYDSSNADASVTAGEVEVVTGGSEAADLFGADSELAYATSVAAANPVGDIHCVPLDETKQDNETIDESGTLSNGPVQDPNVHPDESIDADSANVVVTYDTGLTTSDVDSGDVLVNPVTREVQGETGTNYDITYTYSDFSSAAATAAAEDVRFVVGLTEDPSAASSVLSEVESEAVNGAFKRGVVGAEPEIGTADIGSYSTAEEDYRHVEVAPARAYNSDGNQVRTAAAVGGLLAGQPINADGSILYDELGGIDSLHTEYRPTNAEDFSQVTAVDRTRTVTSARTTSSEDEFSRVHAVEILDLIAEAAMDTINTYRGASNINERRVLMAGGLRQTLRAFGKESPPLVQASSVTIENGDTDRDAVVTLAVEPTAVMEEVELNINSGDIVTFDGASA